MLSRRAHLEETQKESRDRFLNNLKVGEVREGTVSSVVSFGAFVDLGGMDSLIHVSELSWKHVDRPGSVVAVGDQVKVQVLDVDMSRERISLSLKATQQDPWQEFAPPRSRSARLRAGYQARPVRRLRPGRRRHRGARAHLRDVDPPRRLARQVVTPGEELWVKIIDLDLARRRISLSIKRAAEGGELAEEYREHFEVDEQGNWASAIDAEARRPGPSTTAMSRACRRAEDSSEQASAGAEAEAAAQSGAADPVAADAAADADAAEVVAAVADTNTATTGDARRVIPPP